MEAVNPAAARAAKKPQDPQDPRVEKNETTTSSFKCSAGCDFHEKLWRSGQPVQKQL